MRHVAATLLLGIAVAGCATSPTDSGITGDNTLSWNCQRNPTEDGHLWVNKTLTAEGRPESRSVGWRFPATGEPGTAGTELFWTIPADGPWHARLDRGEFNLTMTEKPVGAVSAALELDNAIAVREQVLDRRSGRGLRKVRAWGATVHLQTVSSRLHSATSARILVADEDGRLMATIPGHLPDWPLVDRLVAEALVALDRDAVDYQRNCERQTGPEI